MQAIVCVAILLLVFDVAMACQPMRIHYQSTYCGSDVAAIVLVTSEVPQGRSSTDLVYHATIIDVFKGDQLTAGLNVTVKTPGLGNSCGPRILRKGVIYLIMGGLGEKNTIHTRVFNGALQISDINTEETFRRRMALYKSVGCSCDVKSVPAWSWPSRRNPSKECEPRHESHWEDGACQRQNGQCTWTTNVLPTPLTLI
ncbi:hypothetical protein FSP39_002970 [Pinctada imbricata]|uniref:NTR domain-containing protein n=1 Tax=Pinctada imbricata TaxID=66713 RepID=A0AA88Y672_PINIB|nr:hypothetical protein FSP39_002970 [Pinctada imbricata]